MKRKRRTNQLEAAAARVVKLSTEACPGFEEAEKLFYAEEKSKNRLKRTIAWHRENIKAFKKALQEQNISLNLEEIDHRTIKNNFILYTIENWNNKPQTINMRIRSLRQFFSFLVEEGYLAQNPAVRVEKLKTEETLIVALTGAQVKKILKAVDRNTFTGLRDYTMLLLMLETGVRLSELSHLKINNINFQEGTVKVFGKGARERVVPIQRRCKKQIQQYISFRGTGLGHDHLFVTIDNEPIKNRTIQERLEILTQKAGLAGVQTSPHIWRHTFARFYILNGGDPFSLKKILGHKSWEMVHHYVSLFGSQVVAQHQKASPVEHLDDWI
ncbi:MAG: tyrosine-type recombinase/integrase [Firmicutes bacterium]|nr:tyrosine-type recombinase/integrase [Bacillota bacterium]